VQRVIMMRVTNEELIRKARSVVKPRKIQHGFMVGDVGSALVTDKGNIYLGTCIDTSSGMGFCAEQSAIAAMITHGEHRIKKIVAVSKEGIPVPPCGRCREFIHQIHEKNLATEVILGRNRVVTLNKLLPYRWDE
jgi:cytidine deaminase